MKDFSTIPDCFYRVSVKALVLNETRDKFMITKDVIVDKAGRWDVPGGGLDWGENIQSELQRELSEEMGLTATTIAPHPSYFVTDTSELHPTMWVCNVLYEATLEHFDFTPSEECTDIAWVGHDNASEYDMFKIVRKLLQQFDPKLHQR